MAAVASPSAPLSVSGADAVLPPASGQAWDWTSCYKLWDNLEEEEEEGGAAAGGSKGKGKSGRGRGAPCRHGHSQAHAGCDHHHHGAEDGDDKPFHPAAACNHDHSAERRIYEMPLADQIRSCAEFKRVGNMFFKEGQFFRAAEKYRMCMVYYEYCFPETEEQQAELDRLRLECLLNLASCKLRTRQYDEVIDSCTQVLSKDPVSVKALFRRAQAHRCKDSFEEALADIAAACKLDPTSTALRAEAQAIKSRLERFRAAERKAAGRMFEGATSGARPQSSPDGEDAADVDVYARLRRGGDILPE